MDAYEATRIVFTRIQSRDPEHASKIMGLLIQDHGEKEMIRLAFGPESLVHSVIVKARAELGLSSNASSPPLTPSSPFVFGAGGSALSLQNSSSPAGGVNLPASSPYPAQWEPSLFSDFQNLEDLSNGSSELSLMDDLRYRDQLSLLSDYGSPASGTRQTREILEAASFPPYGGNAGRWRGSGLAHRRSCSVNDVCFGGSDDLTAGLEWKPCLYYSRGYCKNGTTCRFLHGGLPDVGASSDFPTNLELMEQYPELLRTKYTSRAAATAAVMSEFGRSHLEFKPAIVNSSSRQIYLTFPADSTFREEDVSKYFSIYGPVQDVRIPYQQKRMFGFVSFVYAETVRVILAIGNPHYVCDARVLVKPYKEKGKVPDKYRKQQPVERLEFSACVPPTSHDSRSPLDLQLGRRTVYNNSQEMLWRRKMREEADLQQAIELQCRRLMNIQLLDIKKPYQHPTISPFSNAQSRNSPKFGQENCSSPVVSGESPNMAAVSAEKESSGKDEDASEFLVESLEHNLPDNLFASPKKSAGEYGSLFSHSATGEAESSASPTSALAPYDPIASSLLLASSTLGMASIKSCRFPIPPRISSSQETVGV